MAVQCRECATGHEGAGGAGVRGGGEGGDDGDTERRLRRGVQAAGRIGGVSLYRLRYGHRRAAGPALQALASQGMRAEAWRAAEGVNDERRWVGEAPIMGDDAEGGDEHGGGRRQSERAGARHDEHVGGELQRAEGRARAV